MKSNRDLNRDIALCCADHGIAVFPCSHENKKPLVRWREQSTTDGMTLARWWRQRPGSLPGIDLAKINAIVLDGDRHSEGIDGRTNLRNVFIEHKIRVWAHDAPARGEQDQE